MSNEIERYLNNPMVKILGGAIELRDDRIKTKWKTEIKPFLLAPNPVTVDLYNAITNKTTKSSVENHKPVVNVSWNDAISFCNLLSQKSGLKKLILSAMMENILFGIGNPMGIDFQQKQSGNMHVKQKLLAINMAS